MHDFDESVSCCNILRPYIFRSIALCMWCPCCSVAQHVNMWTSNCDSSSRKATIALVWSTTHSLVTKTEVSLQNNKSSACRQAPHRDTVPACRATRQTAASPRYQSCHVVIYAAPSHTLPLCAHEPIIPRIVRTSRDVLTTARHATELPHGATRCRP